MKVCKPFWGLLLRKRRLEWHVLLLIVLHGLHFRAATCWAILAQTLPSIPPPFPRPTLVVCFSHRSQNKHCLCLPDACHMLTSLQILFFSWFLWYIQHHYPHMVFCGCCFCLSQEEFVFCLSKVYHWDNPSLNSVVCLVHLIILPR